MSTGQKIHPAEPHCCVDTESIDLVSRLVLFRSINIFFSDHNMLNIIVTVALIHSWMEKDFRWHWNGISQVLGYISLIIELDENMCSEKILLCGHLSDVKNKILGFKQMPQRCTSLKCRCILLVWRLEPVASNPMAAVAPKSCVCTSWLSRAVRSLSQLMVSVWWQQPTSPSKSFSS